MDAYYNRVMEVRILRIDNDQTKTLAKCSKTHKSTER